MTPDPHLDANLIGAFLDGGLTRRGRRPVMRHIERCDRCRGLAASANTALDVAGASVRFHALPRRGRPLVWAAPLAAAVAMAVAMFPHARRPTPPVHLASTHLAELTTPVRILATVAPVAPPTPPTSARAAQPAADPTFVLATTAPLPLAVWTEPLSEAALAPPPLTDPIIQPSIDFSPLTTGFLDQPQRAPRAQMAVWSVPANDSARSSRLATAAVAEQDGADDTALGGGAAVPPMALANGLTSSSGPFAPSVPAGLGWALSHSGKILRSVGGIWSAVPVPSGIRFHAVQALGTDLWAGGTVSQLYVSQDRGEHWRPVHLPQALAADDATISSIDFADAQHGAVQASNGLTWATDDGGQHWRISH